MRQCVGLLAANSLRGVVPIYRFSGPPATAEGPWTDERCAQFASQQGSSLSTLYGGSWGGCYMVSEIGVTQQTPASTIYVFFAGHDCPGYKNAPPAASWCQNVYIKKTGTTHLCFREYSCRRKTWPSFKQANHHIVDVSQFQMTRP